MVVHHGGKVGKAASKLAKSTTSKPVKSKSGKMLKAHQDAKH